MTSQASLPGISIVCVYNDLDVRRACLDRSLSSQQLPHQSVEYIPVDNRNGCYTTAGAALNYGASLASNDYLIFVHQDILLHSIPAVRAAAAELGRSGRFGMLGAGGVAKEGTLLGRVRDRLLLIGRPVSAVAEVDSVDEMAFLVPREVWQRTPLSEAPDLAWHAYAVEYALRLRHLGLRTGVIDMFLTHNSLTTNLRGLEGAHEAIARSYPRALPFRTTCGIIRAPHGLRHKPLLQAHRWRYRWLRESVAARAGHRVAGGNVAVLGDIRHNIDRILGASGVSLLQVVNVDDHEPPFPSDCAGVPLRLRRRNAELVFASVQRSQLQSALNDKRLDGPTLITNLTIADLKLFGKPLPAEKRIIGYQGLLGFWMLTGVEPTGVAPWDNRSTPLRLRRSLSDPCGRGLRAVYALATQKLVDIHGRRKTATKLGLHLNQVPDPSLPLAKGLNVSVARRRQPSRWGLLDR